MADYDLGTAHGRVKIDYDGSPLRKVKTDFDSTKTSGNSMFSAFKKGFFDAKKDIRGASTDAKSFGTALRGLLGISGTIGQGFKQFAAIGGLISSAWNATVLFAAGVQGAAVAVNFLWNAITQLSGAVGLIPGLLIGAGIAAATLKVALSGVGKAFKAALKAEDAKAFQEAIKDLSPPAQQFITVVRELKTEWQSLQKTVQGALFANLGNEVRALAGTYLPLLRTEMTGVATSINGLIMEFSKFLQARQTVDDVRTSFSLTRAIIDNLRTAIQPLLSIFRDVGVVALQVIRDMTTGVGPLTQRWADFVAQARETGKLKAWIEGGVQGFKDLFAILVSVGSAIHNVVSALAGGGGLDLTLSNVRQLAEEFKNWTASDKVQQSLQKLGDFLRHVLTGAIDLAKRAWDTFVPAIQAAMPFILQTSDAISSGLVAALIILAPILRAVGSTLSFLSPVLAPIIGSVLALGVGFKILKFALSPIAALINVAIGSFKMLGTAAGWVTMLAARLGILGGAAKGAAAANSVSALSIVAAWARSVGETVALAAMYAGSWVKMAAAAALNRAKIVAEFVLLKASQALIAVWDIGIWIAKWVAMAVAATVNAAKIVAAWLLVRAQQAGAAIVEFAIFAAAFIAKWVLMSAAALLHAARIAAAWFIAMGPIGWITAAIIALALLIILNWDKIKNATITVWTATWAFLVGIWSQIYTWITTKLTAIVTWWNTSWASMKARALAEWTAISTAAMAFINRVVAFFAGLPGRIAVWWDQTWANMKAKAQAEWESISQTVSAGIDTVVQFFAELPGKIGAWWDRTWADLKAKAQAALDTVIQAVSNAVNQIVQFFSGLPGKLSGVLGQLVSWAAQLGTGIVQGIGKAIAAGWNWLIDLVRNLAIQLFKAALAALGIGSPSKLFKWAGEMMMKGWAKGIVGGASKVLGAIGQIIAWIWKAWHKPKPPPVVPPVIPPTEPPPPPPPPSTGVGWDPYARPTGASWARDPYMSGPISVTIDAKTVAEMNSVVDFFSTVQQTARAGRTS
jgi:hypothetical protein